MIKRRLSWDNNYLARNVEAQRWLTSSNVETQGWQIAGSLLAAWQRARSHDAVLRKLAEVAAQGGTAAMIATQLDDTAANALARLRAAALRAGARWTTFAQDVVERRMRFDG
jgi:hypothetical protein